MHAPMDTSFSSLFPFLFTTFLTIASSSSSQSPPPPPPPPSNFSFPSFSPHLLTAISPFGTTLFLASGRIGLTPLPHPPRPSCGRALYGPGIRLSLPETKSLASFSTSFNFLITPGDGCGGEGRGDGDDALLAFFMAGTTAFHSDCTGESLGLSSSKSSDAIVAVEFDTFRNPFDPNDNHVAIDINEVVSVATSNISKKSINIKGGQTISAWVDYDGASKNLSVFVAFAHFAKPVRHPILSYLIDLSSVLPETVYIGFSASSNSSTIHEILTWSFSTWSTPAEDQNKKLRPPSAPGGGRSRGSVVAGVSLAVLATVGALAAFYITRQLRMSRTQVGGYSIWKAEHNTGWEQV